MEKTAMFRAGYADALEKLGFSAGGLVRKTVGAVRKGLNKLRPGKPQGGMVRKSKFNSSAVSNPTPVPATGPRPAPTPLTYAE